MKRIEYERARSINNLHQIFITKEVTTTIKETKLETIIKSADERSPKRIWYRGCEGFGYIEAEYVNNLKINNRSYVVSDDDFCWVQCPQVD